MNEIKILHLFPKLLSLYGEYGNIAVLKAALENCTVTECEDGNADFESYDFIYVGSGTEDNLMIALERLLPHAEKIAASAKTKVWLATGNAMALFGKTLAGKNALGVFGYETFVDDKRYLGDVLTDSAPETLGFINTSCRYEGIENPLLQLVLNKDLGNDKKSPAEGIREGNFFGTQLIGPFLAKNPHYLAQMVELLTGESYTPTGYGCKAYDVAVAQLRQRAGLTE